MDFPAIALVGFGILSSLLSCLANEVAADRISGSLGDLWGRCMIGNHDLMRSLRKAYEQALVSIVLGLREHTNPVQNLYLQFREGKIVNEFATALENDYFYPFMHSRNLTAEQASELRSIGKKQCSILKENAEEVMGFSRLAEATIDDLMWCDHPHQLSQEIENRYHGACASLIQRAKNLAGIDLAFCDFLAYRDLLPRAVTFFFREELKQNERLRAVMNEFNLQSLSNQGQEHFEKLHSEIIIIREDNRILRETVIQILEDENRIPRMFQMMASEGGLELFTPFLKEGGSEIANRIIKTRDHIKTGERWDDREREKVIRSIYLDPKLHERYDFDEEKDFIAETSTSRVYRVCKRSVNETRALKILRPDITLHPEFVARFLREAFILRQIRHPFVVSIYDSGGGGIDEIYFMELEWVEGITLRDWLAAHPVSERTWPIILDFTRQIGFALHELHKSRIWHRDVNPNNLMVQPGNKIKLMDFGIAKIAGQEAMTIQGVPFGTRNYWSPEQARGDPEISHLTDIYSFGVVAYELATDKFPQRLHADPIRQFNARVPAWFNDLVLSCVAAEPSNRPFSMESVADSLEQERLITVDWMKHPVETSKPEKGPVKATMVKPTPGETGDASETPVQGPGWGSETSRPAVQKPGEKPEDRLLEIQFFEPRPESGVETLEVETIACASEAHSILNDTWVIALLQRCGVQVSSVSERLRSLGRGKAVNISARKGNTQRVRVYLTEPGESGALAFIRDCLRYVRDKKVHSLAVRFSGATSHAIFKEPTARALAQELAALLRKDAQTSLEKLVIVVYQAEDGKRLGQALRAVGFDINP